MESSNESAAASWCHCPGYKFFRSIFTLFYILSIFVYIPKVVFVFTCFECVICSFVNSVFKLFQILSIFFMGLRAYNFVVELRCFWPLTTIRNATKLATFVTNKHVIFQCYFLSCSVVCQSGGDPCKEYVRGSDVLDIWFDSGVSWATVLTGYSAYF